MAHLTLRSDSPLEKGYRAARVILNGEVVDLNNGEFEGRHGMGGENPPRFEIYVNREHQDIADAIMELRVCDIDTSIAEISLPVPDPTQFLLSWMKLEFLKGQVIFLELSSQVKARHWNKPWSAEDFRNEIQTLFPNLGDGGTLIFEDDSSDDFLYMYWTYEVPRLDGKLKDIIDFYWLKISKICQRIESNLLLKLDRNSLTLPFLFPEEIRLSCEQYLLYFAQFLKDVGVEATAEIKHESGESGRVLFSVTPAGGKEALERVRQALEVYLGLAQAPIMHPDFSAPVEVQALQRQIRYFQMEMDVAESVIQHKDAAIALKDELIAQLQQRRVFAAAQGENKSENERKVAVLQGLVHLKRWDLKAVDLDLPELYYVLRKWFADESSTSNLPTYLKANGFFGPEDTPPALPLKTDES